MFNLLPAENSTNYFVLLAADRPGHWRTQVK
jgi:hypothetical protein